MEFCFPYKPIKKFEITPENTPVYHSRLTCNSLLNIFILDKNLTLVVFDNLICIHYINKKLYKQIALLPFDKTKYYLINKFNKNKYFKVERNFKIINIF